jgi:hypothetical protein
VIGLAIRTAGLRLPPSDTHTTLTPGCWRVLHAPPLTLRSPARAGRLRATWLAEAADLLGLATFMHAAGITCSQRLGDLLAALDPADEATAVALLGATR